MDYLTVSQTAERLQVCEKTVRRWCEAGVLPFVQLVERGIIRIPAGEIEKRVLR